MGGGTINLFYCHLSAKASITHSLCLALSFVSNEMAQTHAKKNLLTPLTWVRNKGTGIFNNDQCPALHIVHTRCGLY